MDVYVYGLMWIANQFISYKGHRSAMIHYNKSRPSITFGDLNSAKEALHCQVMDHYFLLYRKH